MNIVLVMILMSVGLVSCKTEEIVLEEVEIVIIEKRKVIGFRSKTVVEFSNGERRSRFDTWGEVGDKFMTQRKEWK